MTKSSILNNVQNIDTIATDKTRLQELRETGTAAYADIQREAGFENIPLHKLIQDPDNERKTIEGLDGLVESIREFGILEPLRVIPVENDQYKVQAGQRRLLAAELASLPTAPCIIVNPKNDFIKRCESLNTNIQRENLPPIELALAIKQMLEFKEVPTQRALAKKLGRSEQWISDILKILRLPEPLQQELRKSEIKLSYDSVIRIARLDDPQFQEELLGDLLGGDGKDVIRKKIRERKEPTEKLPRRPKYTLVTNKWKLTLEFKKQKPTKADFETALEEALESIDELRG